MFAVFLLFYHYYFKYRTYLCGEWCIKVGKKGQILVLNIRTNVGDAFKISFNACLWLPQNAPNQTDFILNVIICMIDISVHCFGFLECMSLVLCRQLFRENLLRSRRVVPLSRNQIPWNRQSFISLMYVCKNSLYHVLSSFKVIPACLLMWTRTQTFS